jgi:hypothetical protein
MQIMLPSAYWLLSLFKTVSKYNTAPLRQKKALYLTCFPKVSRSVHALTTHAVNTVQFKVNGTDPYMAMVYFAYRPTAALIGYTHQYVWSTG